MIDQIFSEGCRSEGCRSGCVTPSDYGLGMEQVSVAELFKKCSEILDRAMRGERFIICRHQRPIATLQPLNGVVVQPYEGRDYDVNGSPLSDACGELEKLTEAERTLLRDGVSGGRLIFGHGGWEAMKSLVVRGLARKSADRGIVITARGLVLREELLVRAGRDPTDCWLGGHA